MALLLGGGIVLSLLFGFWYAFPLLLAGLILLLGYIFLGTVQSAAQFIQKMDFIGAEKRLGLTLKPNWLYVSNRAFFYIMKGSIAQNLGRTEEAEEWLHKAQKLKLPTDNEKAAVELQLANIAAQKNKWNQAKMHFRALKQLKVTEQELKEQIKQFGKVMGNQGQMKAASRMGGGKRKGAIINPGGKRRRPKMR